MVESIISSEMKSLDLNTRIEGHYIEENPKSLHIRLPSGSYFWVPKRFVDSEFSKESNIRQIFIIISCLLKKQNACFRVSAWKESFRWQTDYCQYLGIF